MKSKLSIHHLQIGVVRCCINLPILTKWRNSTSLLCMTVFKYLNVAVAMYYAINPNSFKTRFINVEVETEPGLCFGRTVCDKFGTLKKE